MDINKEPESTIENLKNTVKILEEEINELSLNNNSVNNEKEYAKIKTNNQLSSIKINTNFKKELKIKNEGIFTYLPPEYLKAIDELKKVTGFNKSELGRMAYEMLFEKFGVKIIK